MVQPAKLATPLVTVTGSGVQLRLAPEVRVPLLFANVTWVLLAEMTMFWPGSWTARLGWIGHAVPPVIVPPGVWLRKPSWAAGPTVRLKVALVPEDSGLARPGVVSAAL